MQLKEVCLQSALDRVSAALTSMIRLFHHLGARTDGSPDWEVAVWRGGGSKHQDGERLEQELINVSIQPYLG